VIIMFSASEEIRIPAEDSPSIDAFLLKTSISRLVPMARQLLGLPAAGRTGADPRAGHTPGPGTEHA
jgi:hypothetical protein